MAKSSKIDQADSFATGSYKMIPFEVQQAIEDLAFGVSMQELAKAQRALSGTYHAHRTSASVFSDPLQRLVYLVTRFPACFAVLCHIFERIQREIPTFTCDSLLDVGAGPGTATLAARGFWGEGMESHLWERESGAIEVGKRWIATTWHEEDFLQVEKFPASTLCVLSYSLGEVQRGAPFFERLWDSPVAYFLFVEPGTPYGYRKILEARSFFLSKGASSLMPCPHDKRCPLQGNNWCHFGAHVPRSRLHRLVKGGELGYEEEKFSYVFLSRKKQERDVDFRILRPPRKEGKRSKVVLCTKEGEEVEEVLASKKVHWGDVGKR